MPESLDKMQHSVWQVVSQIPYGQVASYGQIARLSGAPSHARLVGRILSRLPPETRLPWHRVVNSQGKITNPAGLRQKVRLEAEGVTLINGRINLQRFGWDS